MWIQGYAYTYACIAVKFRNKKPHSVKLFWDDCIQKQCGACGAEKKEEEKKIRKQQVQL
jgi:hypothetical protein